MKRMISFLSLILFSVALHASDSLSIVYRIRLDQDIDQSAQRLVTVGLEKALKADADYVILDINTYDNSFLRIFLKNFI